MEVFRPSEPAPSVDELHSGHEQAAGEGIGLPLDPLLRSAGPADDLRLFGYREELPLRQARLDMTAVQPPVSYLVRDRESVPTPHGRMLVRVQILMDVHVPLTDTEGAQSVRGLELHGEIVEVQPETEMIPE